MRGEADGFNAAAAEKPRSERDSLHDSLHRAEAQAALGRKIAIELARPLGELVRVGPADVVAARAVACIVAPHLPGVAHP